MPKIDALTSLRFFAAASVVYFHMSAVLGVPSMPQFAVGVSFFFVLSGFILTYTYGERETFDARAFYVSRFARIWPVHLATFLITLALVPISSGVVAVATLALVQAWVPLPVMVSSGNWVSWSISDEAAFYLLFPILAFSRYGIPAVVGFVVVVLVALEILFTPAQIGTFHTYDFSPFIMIMLTPFVRILEFVAGIIACRVFLNYRPALSRLQATALEISGVGAVVAYALTSQNFSGHGALGLWYSQSGGFIVFAAVIFVFAYQRGALSKALTWWPLVFLGEISFCTYMVHQLVLRAVDQFHLPLNAVAIVAIIYFASFMLWWTVERPARRLIVKASARSIRRVTAKS